MHWQWISRQGNNRQSNNDAVAIFNDKSLLFVLLADAAEKGNKGAELACYWTQTIAHYVKSANKHPTPAQIVDYMRETHKQLKYQYLHEIASYIILIYDKNTENGWVLHCGDCRLGIKQLDSINWLTNVHTFANANGDFFNSSHFGDPKRHKVTRYLNAKRFMDPEIQQVTLPKDATWLLCTDGYWAEHRCEQIAWEQLSDDASCLEIYSQLSKSELRRDYENYFILSR